METLVEQSTVRTLASEGALPHLLKDAVSQRDETAKVTEAAEPKPKKYGDIVVIKRSGRDGGRFPILSDTNIVIGRSENCNIRVVIETASEQHVQISVEREKVWLKNLAKMRGSTFVNHCVVMPNEKKALFAGDVIAICDREFRIELTPTEKTPAKSVTSTSRRSVSASPAKVLAVTQKGNSKPPSRAGSASPARTTVKSPGRGFPYTSATAVKALPSKIPTRQRPASMLPVFRIGQLPRPIIEPFSSPSLEESLKERRLSSWSQKLVQSTPKNAPTNQLIDLDAPALSPLGQPHTIRTRHLLDATLTPVPTRNGGDLHFPMETADDSFGDQPLAINDSSKTISEVFTGDEGQSALDENAELVPPTPTSQMPPFNSSIVMDAAECENNPTKVVEQAASGTPAPFAEIVAEATTPAAVDDDKHEDDEPAIEGQHADLSNVRRSSRRSSRASNRGQQMEIDTNKNETLEDQSSLFNIFSTPQSSSARRSANSTALSVRSQPPKSLDDTIEEEPKKETVEEQSLSLREEKLLSPKNQVNQSAIEQPSDVLSTPCEGDVTKDAEEAVNQSTVVSVDEPLVEANRSQVIRRSTRSRLASSGGRQSVASVDQKATEEIEEQPSPIPIDASSTRRSSTRSRSSAKRQSSVQAEKSPSMDNESLRTTPKQPSDDQLIDLDAQNVSPLLDRSRRSSAPIRHLLDATLTPAANRSVEHRKSTDTVGDSFGDRTPVTAEFSNTFSVTPVANEDLSAPHDTDDHVPPTPTCQLPPFQPIPVVVSAAEESASNIIEQAASVSPLKSAESAAAVEISSLLDIDNDKNDNNEQSNEADRSAVRRQSSRRNSAKSISTSSDSNDEQKKTDVVVVQRPKGGASRRSSTALQSSNRQPSQRAAKSLSPQKLSRKRVTASPRHHISTSNETPFDELIDDSAAENIEKVANDTPKQSIEVSNEQQLSGGEEDDSTRVRRSSRRSARTSERQLIAADDSNEKEEEEKESPTRINSSTRRSSSARRSTSSEVTTDDTATEADHQTSESIRLEELALANTPPRYTPPRSPRVPAKSTLRRHPRVVASVSEATGDLRRVDFTPEPVVKLIPRIGTKSVRETERLENEQKKAAAERASLVKTPSAEAATEEEVQPKSPAAGEDTSPLNACSKKRSPSDGADVSGTPPTLEKSGVKRRTLQMDEDVSDEPGSQEKSPSPRKTPGKRAQRSKTTTDAEEIEPAALESTVESTEDSAVEPSETANEDTPNKTADVTEEAEPAPQKTTRKRAAAVVVADAAPSAAKDTASRRTKRKQEPAEKVEEAVLPTTRTRRTVAAAVEAAPPPPPPPPPPAKRRGRKPTVEEDVTEPPVTNAKKPAEKKSTTTAKKTAPKTTDAAPAAAKKPAAATRPAKRAAKEEQPASPPKRGRRAMKKESDEAGPSAIADAAPESPAKSRTKKATATQKTAAPTAEKKKQAAGKAAPTTRKAPSAAKEKPATRPAKDAQPASPVKRGRRTTKNAKEAGTSAVVEVVEQSPPKQRASKAAPKKATAVQKPTAAAGKAKATAKKLVAVVNEAPPATEKSAAKRPTKRGKEQSAEPDNKTMPPPKSTRGRRAAAVVVEPVEEPPVDKGKKAVGRPKKN